MLKILLKWLKYCGYGYVFSLLISAVLLKVVINNKVEELEKSGLIEMIEEAKSDVFELPPRFYEIYSIMKPNVFKYNYLEHALFTGRRGDCPCYQNWYWLYIFSSTNRFEIIFNKLLVVFYMEDNLTQQQCFAYNMWRMDFLYSTSSVCEASDFYFNKNLDELNDGEIINLLLMFDNPSLYNPKRNGNQKRLKNRIREIEDQIKATE